MADTIPDVTVSNTEWTNLNTASSIAVGTAMVVSNKSNTKILMQITPVQPSPTSKDGEVLCKLPDIYSTRQISAGESAIWAKADLYPAQVSVQEG